MNSNRFTKHYAVAEIRATAHHVAVLDIVTEQMAAAGNTDEESPLWETLLMISKERRDEHAKLFRLLEQHQPVYDLADGTANYVAVMNGFAYTLIEDSKLDLQKWMENERTRPSRPAHREERRGALSAGHNPYERAKSDVSAYERAKELLINLGNGGDVEPQPQRLPDPPEEIDLHIQCVMRYASQFFSGPKDDSVGPEIDSHDD